MSVDSHTLELKKFRLTLHYYGLAEEKKTPVIFIHGAGGNGTLWHNQLLGLARVCTPLAVDLPGHGSSEGEAADRISTYREQIKDFIESAGLSKAVLCGHSMGGAIAMDCALNYPENLAGLILVSTGARLKVAPKILETYREGKQNLSLAKHLYGPDAREELVREGEKMLAETPPEVSYSDFTACDQFDAMEEISNIDLPTLVLCGEQDAMTPPKYSRSLAEKIPGARLELFPTGGHMLMQEQADQVNKAISRFLQDKNLS